MRLRTKYYLSAFLLGLLFAGPIQVLAEDQEIINGTMEEPVILEPLEEDLQPVEEDISVQEEAVEQNESEAPTIQYSAHVENIGDQELKSDGEMAGTEGKSLRMEAITINLDTGSYDGDIQYAAHVENIGWQDPVSSSQMAGTTGHLYR